MLLFCFLASLILIADGQLLSGIKVSIALLSDQFMDEEHDALSKKGCILCYCLLVTAAAGPFSPES
jgi:hypothetical protein